MKVTRRVFLKSSGLVMASVGVAPVLGPGWLRASALGAETRRRKTLICLFQRGAVDGLSMVVPHGDPHYYQHRALGGIALARTGEDSVLDLDGTFGLHPALKSFKPLYAAGHLAAIQAVGSPDNTRSHFDAQDYMELATPGFKSQSKGWLSRALAACPEDAAKSKSLRAVALTGETPLSLRGSEALAFANLSTFGIGGAGRNGRMIGALPPSMSATGGFEGLYENAVGDVLHDTTRDAATSDPLRGAGRDSFEALRMLERIRAERYTPANNAQYPRTRWGESLKQIAQLIKSDIGLEVAFAESGGWDTHAGQGGARGQLARRLTEWSDGITALYTDLGDRMADVVILTMSEFGRTVRQNGSGGTDHGHATCFFALGGSVRGGQVLGEWPGLAPERLHENRDLEVTTDFRHIFAEMTSRHLGARDLTGVFPNFQSSPAQFRNVLRV